jgi:adenosylcobinamide-GDP ribazoletransferase
MRSLIAAFRFLTRLPIPGPETRASDVAQAVPWFPLVGAVVGLITAGVFVAALRWWTAPVAATVAVASGLLLTGGFHEDGLTDAADGLGGGWTRERVIEIMKDSRIGAYGSMALWAALTLRWACLTALGNKALIVLPFAMLWGRWSIACALRLLPPIAAGLAKEVHDRSGNGVLVGASIVLAAGLAVSFKLGVPRFWEATVVAICVALVWSWYLFKRMGGHSGDLLGATSQIVESAVLLTVLVQ